MAGKAADAAKGSIRAWLMPEINEIKVSLAKIEGEISTLRAEVRGVKEGDIKALHSEIQSVKDSLNVVQRLAVLEAKVSEYEKSR